METASFSASKGPASPEKTLPIVPSSHFGTAGSMDQRQLTAAFLLDPASLSVDLQRDLSKAITGLPVRILKDLDDVGMGDPAGINCK